MSFVDFRSAPDDLGPVRDTDLHTSMFESLGATIAETLDPQSGVSASQLWRRLNSSLAGNPNFMPALAGAAGAPPPQAADEIPDVPMADAKARVKQEGLDGQLPLPDQPSIKQPVLDLMINEAHEHRERQTAIARGPQGFFPGALEFATSIGAGLIDPVNMAAFSVPVLGEARWGKMLASAGDSVINRAGVRALQGAAQGAAGTALLQPAEWWFHTQDGRDYTMAEALRSVALGAGMGAAFHAGIGAVGDVRARMQGQPLPGSTEETLARALQPQTETALEGRTAPRDASEQAQVLAGTNNEPAPATRLNAGQDFADWFAGSQAVTPAGAPLPVFHGTSLRVGEPGFSEFSKGKRGDATGAPSAKEAFFFTEDPELAGSYAETSNLYDEVSPIRFLNRITGGHYERVNETILRALGTSGKSEGRIAVAHLAAKNPLVVDYGGSEFREESFHSIIQRAKQAGHDSVLLKNAVDPGFVDGLGEKPANIWAVFEPDQIKIRSFTRPDADGAVSQLPRSHPARVLADLPEMARADVARAAAADMIAGRPVRVGEMLNEAAKVDPRIAESVAPANRGPQSLLQFIAAQGGISSKDPLLNDFLQAIGGKKSFKGAGKLVTPDGVPLDRMREAAVEAGYLHDPGRDTGGVSDSTVRDLIDAVDTEARGRKVYARGEEPVPTQKQQLDAYYESRGERRRQLQDADAEIGRLLDEHGLSGEQRDDAARRAYRLIVGDETRDPRAAVERALDELDIQGNRPGVGESDLADWEQFADARPEYEDPQAVAESHEAARAEEPASIAPERAVSAAEKAAADARELLADMKPRLSDEEWNSLEEALSNIDTEKGVGEQIVRDGAACLAAAVAA